MLTFEQNVRAILESQFAGFEKEIIEAAVNQIVNLDCKIEAGDEIMTKYFKIVVTGQNETHYHGIDNLGLAHAISKEDPTLRKTDCVYPQVEELLKEMGED